MEALQTVFINLAPLTAALVGVLLAARAWGVAAPTVKKALTVVLLVLLALHLIVFTHSALRYVNYPYEGKSVVEGVTLFNAVKYLDGEQPYRDPTEAPFRSLVYPPVYEMMLAGVVAILGPSLVAGRLFSLLCALGTAFVCGLIVWRHTRNKLASVFGGLFFICCYNITGQCLELVRSDALMALLTVLGLYLVEGAVERGRRPIAGGIVLLLALYTKQPAILGAAAVVIWLWFRSRRMALEWGASFLAAAIAVFVGMQIWSDGWFAFYILKVPALVGMKLDQIQWAAIFVQELWIILWGVVAFTVFLLGQLFRAKRVEDNSSSEDSTPRAKLWAIAFVPALLLSLLQSLKWGGIMNAFIPVTPFLGILGGIAFHHGMERFKTTTWAQLAVLSAAAMQIAILAYGPILPIAEDRTAQERIGKLVRSAPSDVFVSWFSSQSYLNGKTYFGDNVPMGDLVTAGLWRGNAVVEKTEQKGFSLMILRVNIEPPDLAEAVRQNYQVVDRIPIRGAAANLPYMMVCVPKPVSPPPKKGIKK